jgi:hypothetical protein
MQNIISLLYLIYLISVLNLMGKKRVVQYKWSITFLLLLRAGVVFCRDIFCVEISARKLQRLKEITIIVGKSKHEF